MPSTRRSDSANAQKPESTSDPTAEHQCRFQFCIERFQSIRRLFLQLPSGSSVACGISVQQIILVISCLVGGAGRARRVSRARWIARSLKRHRETLAHIRFLRKKKRENIDASVSEK